MYSGLFVFVLFIFVVVIIVFVVHLLFKKHNHIHYRPCNIVLYLVVMREATGVILSYKPIE